MMLASTLRHTVQRTVGAAAWRAMMTQALSDAKVHSLWDGATKGACIVPEEAGMGHVSYEINLAAGEEVRMDGAQAELAELSDGFETRASKLGMGLFVIAGDVTVQTSSAEHGEVQLRNDDVVGLVGSALRGIRATEDSRVYVVAAPHDLGDEGADDVVIPRHFDSLAGSDRDIDWGNGQSRRYFVRSDGLGFALANTLGHPNCPSPLQYKNHNESCHYVQGNGRYTWTGEDGSPQEVPIVTDRTAGQGTEAAICMIMDKHDPHVMDIGDQGSVCISVWTPPIEGTEKHTLTADGFSSY